MPKRLEVEILKTKVKNLEALVTQLQAALSNLPTAAQVTATVETKVEDKIAQKKALGQIASAADIIEHWHGLNGSDFMPKLDGLVAKSTDVSKQALGFIDLGDLNAANLGPKLDGRYPKFENISSAALQATLGAAFMKPADLTKGKVAAALGLNTIPNYSETLSFTDMLDKAGITTDTAVTNMASAVKATTDSLKASIDSANGLLTNLKDNLVSTAFIDTTKYNSFKGINLTTATMPTIPFKTINIG
jgi:hypothetical protein